MSSSKSECGTEAAPKVKELSIFYSLTLVDEHETPVAEPFSGQLKSILAFQERRHCVFPS